jgi:hypothetical protein
LLQVSIVRVTVKRIVNMRHRHHVHCAQNACHALATVISIFRVAGETITESLADELDQTAQRMGHEVGQRRC